MARPTSSAATLPRPVELRDPADGPRRDRLSRRADPGRRCRSRARTCRRRSSVARSRRGGRTATASARRWRSRATPSSSPRPGPRRPRAGRRARSSSSAVTRPTRTPGTWPRGWRRATSLRRARPASERALAFDGDAILVGRAGVRGRRGDRPGRRLIASSGTKAGPTPGARRESSWRRTAWPGRTSGRRWPSTAPRRSSARAAMSWDMVRSI